jgi:AraC-like DNA-binding protein
MTPPQIRGVERPGKPARLTRSASIQQPGPVYFSPPRRRRLNLGQDDEVSATALEGLLSKHGSPPSEGGAGRGIPDGAGTDSVRRTEPVAMPAFGVVAFESRHAPGFATPVLRQDFSEFRLVISGQARLDSGNRMFLLGADSLVHAPAQSELRYQDMPNQPVTLCAIQYRDEILPANLTRQLTDLGVLHWNFRMAASPLLRALRYACKEMLYEQYRQQPGWETVLVSRMFDLVVETIRFASQRTLPLYQPSFEKNSDSVSRVVKYATRLESEFFHFTTLDEAAQATGLSRRRFTALFRSVTGQSWHKRLLDLRLAHARRLLSQTDRTIIAVAFESGFADLSHFNHVFRQAFNCSPSAIRREPRQ